MDEIVKATLSPFGIFEFFDSVGNDIMLASIRNYAKYDSRPERFAPLLAKLVELVIAGLLGQKSGAGFFDYSADLTISTETIPLDPEILKEITRRLNEVYGEAISTYSRLSGYSTAELRSAMNEYLGSTSLLLE